MGIDIYSRPGTKVRYANPNAGYPGETRKAKEHLDPEKVYTVHHTDVYDAHTDVWLDEVPNKHFNSCLFDEV
jgi:hypothetical protein